MVEFTEFNSKIFSMNDFKYCSTLKQLLIAGASKEDIISFLKEFSSIPINGVLREIEIDLKGFFAINDSPFIRYFLKEEFKNFTNDQLLKILLERVEALKEGDFLFPENIYQSKVIAIEFENKIIKIKDLTIDPWDYGLFQSLDKLDEYYLEFIYGTIGLMARIFKVETKDAEILKNSKDKSKIERIINKYRKRIN